MPKEKKYTKEQLIKAQHKYNVDCLNNPEKYEDSVKPDFPTAKLQIEYLISLID